MAKKRRAVSAWDASQRAHSARFTYWQGPMQATPDGGTSKSPASLPKAASQRGGRGQGGGEVGDGRSD